jgi:hypothetical protein
LASSWNASATAKESIMGSHDATPAELFFLAQPRVDEDWIRRPGAWSSSSSHGS